MKYVIEQVPVTELPDVEPFKESKVTEAMARLQAGETPPPLVLYGRRVYDGVHRIAAAKRLGIATLPAAVCPTSGDACLLRHALGANVVKGWARLNAKQSQ